jgi:hypothetical protein
MRQLPSILHRASHYRCGLSGVEILNSVWPKKKHFFSRASLMASVDASCLVNLSNSLIRSKPDMVPSQRFTSYLLDMELHMANVDHCAMIGVHVELVNG